MKAMILRRFTINIGIILLVFSSAIFAQKKPVDEVIYNVVTEKGVEAAIAEYHRLKSEHEMEYDFSEARLNQLGYKLLGEKKNEAALKILGFNKEQFPNSVNVYDSYAEACLANYKNDLAIENYKKVLELLPGAENLSAPKTFFENNAKMQISIAERFNRTANSDLVYYANYGGTPAGKWDVENLVKFHDANSSLEIGYKSFNFYRSPVPYFVHDAFKAARRPDVVSSFIRGVYRDYAASGDIASISDLWKAEGWDKIFPESLKKMASYGGKQYFVPQALQWNPIWYRKDIFEKYNLQPPKTWEDLLAICDKLHENGTIPFTVSGRGWSPPVARWFTILNLRLNGPEFHDEVMKGSIAYTDPKIREVFRYWAQLFEHNAFADSSEENNWANGVNDLSSGNAAMYNIGEWIFEAKAVADVIDKLDFFSLPALNPDVTPAEIVHVYGAFMLSNANDSQSAKNLLTFFAKETSQGDNHQTLKRIASNSKIYSQSPELQKRQYDFIKNAEVLVPLFEFNTHPQMADAALKTFLKFWANPADIETVLAELEKSRQEIFNNDQFGEVK